MIEDRQPGLLDRITDPALRRVLPRGPHGLGREQVRASQRGRLLSAMAEAVAEQGYGPTTVADVIDRAGVSRRTFYEQFTDKHDAFLATYETIDVVLVEVAAAVAEVADPVDRIRRALATYLGLLAEEPAFARTFVIEAIAAGRPALQRRAEVYDRFAALLRAGIGDRGRDLEDMRVRATLGAVNEMVLELLRRDEDDQLSGLTDLATEMVVAVLGLEAS